MYETSKADNRRFNDYLYKRILVGKGIDIGSGKDPFGKNLFKNQVICDTFDTKDGDAQNIHIYNSKIYDFLYSSNCLEHLNDPFLAFENWLKILKVDGYMVVTVPDEDLYEQNNFRRFNKGHKWSFTILKEKSWNQKSINIIRFLEKFVSNIKILRIQLVDSNYDYSLSGVDQTMTNAEAFIEFAIQKIK
jgi:predicted SAM-dependent methyltransferase